MLSRNPQGEQQKRVGELNLVLLSEECSVWTQRIIARNRVTDSVFEEKEDSHTLPDIFDEKMDSLLELLKDSERYVEAQNNLGKRLSQGIFRLARARHSGRSSSCSSISTITVENCRMELDPTTYLEEGSPFVLANVDTAHSDSVVDPLLLLSAMPPKHLRSAQHDFQDALVEVVSLASLANRIMKSTANK